MKLTIRRLQSVFAAEITGMNLRIPPEKAMRQSMDSAMGQFAVEAIRDPFGEEDQHLALAGAMDPLAPTVSNVNAHTHRLNNRDMRSTTCKHSAPTLQQPL